MTMESDPLDCRAQENIFLGMNTIVYIIDNSSVAPVKDKNQATYWMNELG